MRARACALAVVLSAGALSSSAEGFALGVRGSSIGIGAEFTVGLSKSLNLRLGAGGLGYSDDRVVSGIAYDAKLTLKSGSAALDWHPGGAAFRLSGGLLLHDNKVTGVGMPTGPTTIGNHTYTPNEIGTLDVAAEYEHHVAPFVTIGAGNGARGGRVFVSFEAGVLFAGVPQVSVVASRATPGLAADLQVEAQQVQDEVDWLKVYPIVTLGIGFRF